MKAFKLKYANGSFEIVYGNSMLEIVNKYELPYVNGTIEHIFELSGEQEAIAMAEYYDDLHPE